MSTRYAAQIFTSDSNKIWVHFSSTKQDIEGLRQEAYTALAKIANVVVTKNED